MKTAVRSLCLGTGQKNRALPAVAPVQRAASSDRVRLGSVVRKRFLGGQRVDRKFQAVIRRGYAEQVLQNSLLYLERRLQAALRSQFRSAASSAAAAPG